MICDCTNNQMVHGGHTHYESQSSTNCGDSNKSCLTTQNLFKGGERPILHGYYQVMDKGKPVPYAKVTVTYAGSNNLVALFDGAGNAIHNPVKTDINGRAPIFYKGGKINILAEKTDKNGNPCGVVENLQNLGSVIDGDFSLEDSKILACIDIDEPLLRVYNKEKCNLPHGLTTPMQVVLNGLSKLGLPIGTYAQAKKYFECTGDKFPCGLIVYGDSSGSRYRYECENCKQAVPPDPETVTYNLEGKSDCWTRLDEFSGCQYPMYDLDGKESVLTDAQQKQLKVTILGCDGKSGNIRIPPYQAGDGIEINKLTGVISIKSNSSSNSGKIAFYSWNRDGAVPTGTGVLVANQKQVEKHDPDNIFEHTATGVRVKRAGIYYIVNQAGTNHKTNGNVAPGIMVNGNIQPQANSGGGTPYPQNHFQATQAGTYGTAHLVIKLNNGDVVRGAANFSVAGQSNDPTEGFIIYLGAV